MTNLSDFLMNKFAWTFTFNMLLVFLFIPLPLLKIDEWFKNYCRSKDGSTVGLIIMLYGFICVIINTSFYWFFDFQSYDSLGVIKSSIPLAIMTSIIPIMVGREIWKGKKILT